MADRNIVIVQCKNPTSNAGMCGIGASRRSIGVTSSKKPRPTFRVRSELPTLDDAIFAAQGLTDNLDDQIEIVAVLMGLPKDEVRQRVPAPATARKSMNEVVTASRTGAWRSVVVERKAPRRTY